MLATVKTRGCFHVRSELPGRLVGGNAQPEHAASRRQFCVPHSSAARPRSRGLPARRATRGANICTGCASRAANAAAAAKPGRGTNHSAGRGRRAHGRASGETCRCAGPARGGAAQRQLILMWAGKDGKYVDYELWNPFAPDANHQNGPGLFHEPLFYYSGFQDKMIPWLAESYQYSPDYKTLTIKTRSGISWSDGQPFSAKDVAFTITESAKQGAKIKFGSDIATFCRMPRPRMTPPSS